MISKTVSVDRKFIYPYCKHHRLYEVITDNFIVEQSYLSKEKVNRKIVLNKGEIVEFRYFSPANFRTTDDIYLRCSEEMFKANTKPFGDILEAIAFRNKNTLKEILDAKLYDEVSNDENS